INLLKERLKRLRRAEPYDDAALDAPGEGFALSAEKLICVREIVSRMDDSTRKVFEFRQLGYTFEEIGRGKGASADVTRAEFHKRLKRLAKSIRGDTKAGGDASLDEPVT
ncbi:MAG TPA: hypothetical protein VD861_19430, partial [Pyrinomonadaceae bacterium]|nr:hypothetical protein [Pyrinomonadaceae bacterium]